MGGRGTFSKGDNPPYTYKTVGKIDGVKVLEGISGKHALPEESHSSVAYIKLNHDGTFREMRIYDENHRTILEIAYHPEAKINHGNRKDKILHVHEYLKPGNFNIRPVRLITKQEYEKYKKFFKGVPAIEKW